MVKHLKVLGWSVLLVTVLANLALAQDNDESGSRTGLRDVRYCEIIPVYRERLTLRMEVYNTLGFNECPADLWNAIDEAALTEELDAVSVVINGPRYWVIDELVSEGGVTSSDEVETFNGIEMALRAVLEVRLSGNVVGDELYTPNTVERSTRYTFYEGELVYMLVSPQNETYIMQSYSQQIDPDLTLAGLETLGDRLDLPEGWRYEVIELSEEYVLSSGGETTVINDNFFNTYQITEQPPVDTSS